MRPLSVSGLLTAGVLGAGLLAGCGAAGVHVSAPRHPHHSARHTHAPAASRTGPPPSTGAAGHLTIKAGAAGPLSVPSGNTGGVPPGMQALTLMVTITNPTATAVPITNQEIQVGAITNNAAITSADQVARPPDPNLFPTAVNNPGATTFTVTVPAHGSVSGNISITVTPHDPQADIVALVVPSPQGEAQVAMASFTP